MTHVETQKNNEEKKVKQYYHNKHLGSEQFVTDWKGRQYEYIEYTPYGELWTYKSKTAMLFLTTYNNFLAKQPAGLIEETAPGVDKLPFRFTGKELDEETGLYYYGARYLDPKYSRWLSGDPALNDYVSKDYNGASGGIYNTINLNVYHYGNNNPIKYIDPDGRDIEDIKNFTRGTVQYLSTNPLAVWAAQNGIFPNESVGFSFDKNTGLYHATFDCPQGSWFDGNLGYNELYDVAFDFGTEMQCGKFAFSSGGKDYALWAWKGDYLNMGAGAELGIYTKADGILGLLGHYKVDKSLAMDMCLDLILNGKNVGSFQGYHWWATSFNPSVQGVNPDDLSARFTVNFNDKQMYKDFKNAWARENSPWTFNDSAQSATLSF